MWRSMIEMLHLAQVALCVEKISWIESKPRSLTVHTDTSKSLVNDSKVWIEVTDLATNYTIKHEYLNQWVLRPTWGEYRIAPLKPETWYGVDFRSQTIQSPVHTYNEFKMSDGRIQPEEDAIVSTEPILLNQARQTAIQLVVTTLATDQFDVLVRADLMCTSVSIFVCLSPTFGFRFGESWKVTNKCNAQVNDTKLLTLTQNETRGSIEFAIKKVVERKTNSSKVIARLEDDTCSRLCWSVWLRARRINHQYLYGQNCTAVESTDVQVTLRNLVSVHSDIDSVTITTEYTGNSPEGRAEIWLYVRQLQRSTDTVPILATSMIAETTEATTTATTVLFDGPAEALHEITEIFVPVGERLENYTVEGLRENTWYMLNYTYSISEPLEYADYKIEIFKVGTGETGAERVIKAGADGSSSKPSGTGRSAVVSDGDDPYQITKIAVTEELMDMTLRRTHELASYDIAARLLPFCGQAGQQIILNPDNETVWTVNITEARFALKALTARRNDDGNSTSEAVDLSVDSSCTELCWSYEMQMDDKRGETQVLNEKCEQIQKLLDKYGGVVALRPMLSLILSSLLATFFLRVQT